ncbi:MAG: efflux transporter outer membrane subunit [Puniceicoccales bacterium]
MPTPYASCATLSCPLGVVLTFVLAGCASAPPSKLSEMPVEAPAGWTAKDVPEETIRELEPDEYGGGWLADFNDPVLPDLVFRAQARNYNLQAAVARLGVAEAQAYIEGADLYPQAGVGLDGSRTKQNFSGSSLGNFIPPSTNNDFNLTASVSWELDVWGRVRDGQSAAIGDAQAAAADLRGARQSLAANTARLWFTAIEAQMQVALAERTYTSYQKATEAIQGRFERGVSPALDLRLARAQTAAAFAALQARERELDAAKRDLQVLMGDYPSGALETAKELPQIVAPVPVGLPSELLERRPDLVSAERRLASADKRISQAKKAFLPAISLTGSYGTSSSDLSNLLDSNFSVWSIAANLVQPIFQGGRLTGNLQRAKAYAIEALANYGQSALDAFNEVEKSLAAEVYLDKRVAALQDASEESAKAEQTAWQRYSRGLTDIITVLESQRRAFESESAYITVRTQRLNNRVTLYLALGGDFAPGSPEPATAVVKHPFGETAYPDQEPEASTADG